MLWIDLLLAIWHDGSLRLGVGVFLIAADALLVSLYVFSCHSFRHLVGGGLDCYSLHRQHAAPTRHLGRA